jgi:hypothetical protein
VEALRVPEDDPTVWHRSVELDDSIVAARLGSNAVVVKITMFGGRTTTTVARLHFEVAEQLVAIGVERSAILVVIVESTPACWSIGGTAQDQVDVGFEIEI